MPIFKHIAPKVGDREVRGPLRKFIEDEHAAASDTLILEEFALYGGETRADLAAINGLSHGYEIKSRCDTLERLPRQVRAYNAVFEQVTLVSAQCHLTEARTLIPSWWGIVRVQPTSEGIRLSRIRQSRPNPAPEPKAIAALLWRPEVLKILSSLGLDGGIRSKPMPDLISRLVKSISSEHLSLMVRQALRARGDWRFAARLKSYDGTYQQRASSWRFPRAPYGRSRQ
jgi:hypothetical protein